MVVNPRQAFTVTTPIELLQSGIAFASQGNRDAAGDLVQHLTPLPYAAGVSLFGYDPFKSKQVSPGAKTFFSQFGPLNTAHAARIQQYNMTPAERRQYQQKALHPRSKGEVLAQAFGGSLAPYNPEVGQKLALKNGPTLERRTKQLLHNSAQAGFGNPPLEVLEDLA